MLHQRHRHRGLAIALLGILTFLPACAHAMTGEDAQLEVKVRASLDVLREVVDPAVKLADEACAAEQHAYLSEAKAGPKDQVPVLEQKATQAAARCKQVQATFEQIRELHDQAATLLESGKLQDARDRVERVREKWRALSGADQGAAWQRRPSGSSFGARWDRRFSISGPPSTVTLTGMSARRCSTSSASAPTFRSSSPRVMRLSRDLPS